MGWYVEDYNLAQVTVNLSDYLVIPPHVLFEEVKKDVKKLNVDVAGSEIIGVVRLDAILKAAEYYIEKKGLFVLDEDQKVRLAIERIGLNSVPPFNPREKIIDYIIKEELLAGLSVRNFIEEVASRSSAPGGGSASTAITEISAGLGSMVAKLSLAVRKFEDLDEKMKELISPLHKTANDLIPMIDTDTDAFNDYVEVLRLPEVTKKKKSSSLYRCKKVLKKSLKCRFQP
jgi:glutamate formiminotransferase / formiminotetrahydrofolate cyclodeaminase